MKQLLIIGYVWPEPDSSAAGSRMLQLIHLFVNHGWSVTFASSAAPSSHMADIESLGAARVSIALNCASFDAFVAQLQPDLVLFDRFMIEEQFGWRVTEQCPNALRLLDTEDLHSLRAARQQALKAGRKVGTQELNSELAMREIAAILRCDLSLIISSYEYALLTEHYQVPAELLCHLPFMLPPVSAASFVPYQDRAGYISIGNFRHAPNWDAVLHLKSAIWPLIRRSQPDAQLSVYGAYPPPKATRLDDPGTGFRVKGWAADVRKVMAQARICLAPLRFGAGLKGKLVDAMTCGTPNVTSAIGAEAMHADLPWSGAISDDPEGFAQSAVKLYRSEVLWRTAQANGATIINTLFADRGTGQRLLERIADLQQGLAQHRLKNFTGAMLRHHTLQSTRYMAQWIEEKNRRKAQP